MQITALSLWEIMRQYNVWQLTHIIEIMSDWECLSQMAQANGRSDQIIEAERRTLYRPALDYSRQQCEQIELYAAMNRTEKFSNELRNGISWAEFGVQAKILRETIQNELGTRRFAFVPIRKAAILDNVTKDWEQVWGRFPEAKEDSQRAVDCYALGQDSACVFHSIRVAETGLRALAKKMKVRLTHKGKTQPIEYADWEKIITEAKNKITQARTLPAGPKKQAKLEFYSDAADHCMFMKDIWRNTVSHARKSYNDSESMAALTRVREFMQFLAGHL